MKTRSVRRVNATRSRIGWMAIAWVACLSVGTASDAEASSPGPQSEQSTAMPSKLQSILNTRRSLTGLEAQQAPSETTRVAVVGQANSRPAMSSADDQVSRAVHGQKLSMASLWRRYESWLVANFPEGLEGLMHGASPQQLRDLQTALGMQLPPGFQAWAGVHNGQTHGSVGLLDGNELLSSEGMREQWVSMNTLLDEGHFPSAGESDLPGAVEPVWWSKRWIPIASDGSGNLVCIDMAPGPKGTVGQIIDFDHETVHRTVLAPSFEAYVHGFVSDVLAGRYGYSDDYGRLMPLADFDAQSDQMNELESTPETPGEPFR